MGNSDNTTRPPVQQLPDQLAEVRQRRQKHAGPGPTEPRSRPQRPSTDHNPSGGTKRPDRDRDRKPIGAMVNGGLGIDDLPPDDVLEAMTAGPTSPAPPPAPPDTAPDETVDPRISSAVESGQGVVNDGPDVDSWLRHHHERQQPQRVEPSRPRGSAELPIAPTRAARGRKRGPARQPARTKATSVAKTDVHRRMHPKTPWIIATVVAMVVLVVAVVVIGNLTDGHKTRTSDLTGARVLSDGWQGADPRSSEHPEYPAPVAFKSAHLGAAATMAGRFVAKPIHHTSTPVATASTSTASAPVQAASSDETTEANSSPQTTYTAPPSTATTTPSTGSGGGGGSTSGGGSSSSSGTKKTPAYGPAGSLGPGSSPSS